MHLNEASISPVRDVIQEPGVSTLDTWSGKESRRHETYVYATFAIDIQCH
jgi:hypothetical protein